MVRAELLTTLRILTDRGRDLAAQTVAMPDGARLHLRLGPRRPGRPVVLLHGYCGRHQQMLGIARALLDRRTVVLYDARGHGASDGFRQRPTMAQLAADFQSLLKWLEADEVDAIGLSMGAQTLLERVRLQGTAGLGRLVFIDQGPRLRADAGYHHGLFGGLQDEEVATFRRDLGQRPRSLGPAWVRGLWRTNEPLLTKAFLTPALLAGLPGVPEATLRLADDMIEMDWREVVPRIDRPTLLCYGGRSMYPGAGRWMHANLPDSQLEWFEDSGHGLMLTEPRRLHRVVRSFLVA